MPLLFFAPFSIGAPKDEISTATLTIIEEQNAIISVDFEIEEQKEDIKNQNLTSAKTKKAVFNPSQKEFYVISTAYSSSVDETDSSPFITASGADIRKHPYRIVAANFLRIGTKLQLPDLYGDTIFDVQDRMNQRFSDRLDVWQPSKQEAKQFGIRKVKVRIVE